MGQTGPPEQPPHPHCALPLWAIRSCQALGFMPQQLQQLHTGRCSRIRSAAQKGGRVKPCLQKRGHAETQGRWQEWGLVGMGIKSQNTNGFCNKNLIQNR